MHIVVRLKVVFSLDINECLQDNSGCQDQCVNTEGGYYCACSDPELSLAADKSHCIGMLSVNYR